MTTPNPNIGDMITVDIPEKDLLLGTEFFIRLHYKTNENVTATSWMTPAQTAGKKLPYLYTQCEDIACRSVAPMMDTPAARITYDAKVIAPNEFVVKMSANETGVIEYNSTHSQSLFTNTIRMPSYLIAIAVGDLAYRSLGERVGVVTEPSEIDRVANILADVPKSLDILENYLTPYIWGNYTILILPPSFPMGGMENPLLTFASPTIITDDKSQVDVATHEIAHSWTGNQVTCNNWSNMWLNEGFTVFEERKATGIKDGVDVSMVNAYLGNISMYNDMLGFGLDNSYSSLYPEIGNDFPDNSFSTVAYEKGFQFLYYIESQMGETNFQNLLRLHIADHSLTSINYTDFKNDFESYCDKMMENATTVKAAVDWETWVRSPGLPPVTLDFTTTALNESKKMADDYVALGGASSPENFKDYEGWSSGLRQVFVDTLNGQVSNVNETIMKRIDDDLNITMTVDPEVKSRWFPLGIRADYDPVTEPAHQFISSMGR